MRRQSAASSQSNVPWRKSGDRPTTVAVLLIPSFSLLAYASAIEPLRAANYFAGKRLYEWYHIGIGFEPILSTHGLSITPTRIDEAANPDLLLVCAGVGVENHARPETFALLRSFARQKIAIGAISSGAWLLAKAGLLDGFRCTVHWELAESLAEEHPNLQITNRLYEIDRDRLTCSGGIAPMDMMHALIQREYGSELASRVSEWFIQTQVRDGEQPQKMDAQHRFGITHRGLLRALNAMERQGDGDLSHDELAKLAGVSKRQLERLARSQLGCTLGQHHRAMRLDRARLMLQQTTLSILNVALACGFATASQFSTAYRARFSYPPRVERTRRHARHNPRPPETGELASS
ncbi:HTH-type transcriptional regulator CdhR [Rhizobiaceae bacterium]|nr:HTH-type transcriptional regulator CdhR [Rhizobiaceae bacterium]